MDTSSVALSAGPCFLIFEIFPELYDECFCMYLALVIVCYYCFNGQLLSEVLDINPSCSYRISCQITNIPISYYCIFLQYFCYTNVIYKGSCKCNVLAVLIESHIRINLIIRNDVIFYHIQLRPQVTCLFIEHIEQ